MNGIWSIQVFKQRSKCNAIGVVPLNQGRPTYEKTKQSILRLNVSSNQGAPTPREIRFSLTKTSFPS